MVIHKPVDFKTSDQIRSEFLKIFPKEISFYENIELRGFKFTVNIMYISIRYITGIASFISGDPYTALKLHDGLKNQIKALGLSSPPELKHISSNIDEMISSEKYFIALFTYSHKRKIQKAKNIIEECLKQGDNIYPHLLLKSNILFKEDRDVIGSIKAINLASKNANNNFTWLYNKAFILMYINKYRRALHCYHKLSNISFTNEADVVHQCIDFNKNLLLEEPNKIQCLFVIGYLYWKKKSNLPLALESFEQFLLKANNRTEYLYLSNVSRSYIKKITSEMGLNQKKQ